MAAGLLVAHENVPDASGIQVVGGVVEQRISFRCTKARDKAVAQEAAGSVTSVGIKAEADHGFAITNHVGDEGKHADGHLAEINEGVANRRFNRHDRFANVDNLHEFTYRLQRHRVMKVAAAAAASECRKRFRDRKC